jgi:hypothetical protein
VDVRGTTPLQLYAANTDPLKRRLAEAQAAGAKLYALSELGSDGKFGGSVIKELRARAELAMMKLLVERGADVEAVYPKWDPVNSRDVRYWAWSGRDLGQTQLLRTRKGKEFVVLEVFIKFGGHARQGTYIFHNCDQKSRPRCPLVLPRSFSWWLSRRKGYK